MKKTIKKKKTTKKRKIGIKKEPTSTVISPDYYDQLMVVAAFRYCLGQRSYIVNVCYSWLSRIWPMVVTVYRNMIVREIVEALQDNTAGDATIGRPTWKAFAEKAFQEMSEADKKWCRQPVAHRNKPWPLSN